MYCDSSQIKMYPAGQPKSTDEAPYLYEFESMGLNVPRYLQWLVKRLSEPHKDLPGPPVRFLRGYVPSLKAAAELVPGASLVINASGLGAKNLEDVRDDKMYPIRGQTVLVYAPRFRDPKVARCYSRITKDGATYVIPRARSGQVILGGTFDVRKTDTLKPNADVTDRILRNCVELAPELLPETADPNDPTAYVTVDVLRNNIGVRPAREGGVRIELDKPLQVNGHEVGVIHAYGIGMSARLTMQALLGTKRATAWRPRSARWWTNGARRTGRARSCSGQRAQQRPYDVARDTHLSAGIKCAASQFFAFSPHRRGEGPSGTLARRPLKGCADLWVSMSLSGRVGIRVDRLAVAASDSPMLSPVCCMAGSCTASTLARLQGVGVLIAV